MAGLSNIYFHALSGWLAKYQRRSNMNIPPIRSAGITANSNRKNPIPAGMEDMDAVTMWQPMTMKAMHKKHLDTSDKTGLAATKASRR
jgi:hypothetical protein